MKKAIINVEVTEKGELIIYYNYYEKDKKVGYGKTKYSKKLYDEMTKKDLIRKLNWETEMEL